MLTNGHIVTEARIRTLHSHSPTLNIIHEGSRERVIVAYYSLRYKPEERAFQATGSSLPTHCNRHIQAHCHLIAIVTYSLRMGGWHHVSLVELFACNSAAVYSLLSSDKMTVQVSYAYNRKTKLTLTLLTWRIWWAPNNASRWQVGYNSAFKGLTSVQLHFFSGCRQNIVDWWCQAFPESDVLS